jgi:hypothetical protein
MLRLAAARDVYPNDEKAASGYDSLPAGSRHMLATLRHVLPKAGEWPLAPGDLFAGHVISIAIFIMGASFSGRKERASVQNFVETVGIGKIFAATRRKPQWVYNELPRKKPP